MQITYCKEVFFLLYTILKFHEEGKVSSMKSLTTVVFSDVGISRSSVSSVRLLADMLDIYDADSSL